MAAAGSRSTSRRSTRARDLLGLLPTTVFTPDDLVLVKGGPAERRRYLDETLVLLRPSNDALRSDVERILRQRNTLLKQAGGRLTRRDRRSTLDVWDTKFAEAGQRLAEARVELARALEPAVTEAARQLERRRRWQIELDLRRRRGWRPGLRDALADGRDARRPARPHAGRARIATSSGSASSGLPARTQASQGEQRTMALALRLGAHRLAAEHLGVPPVLLLDDVFSELDPEPEPRACSSTCPVRPDDPDAPPGSCPTGPGPTSCSTWRLRS